MTRLSSWTRDGLVFDVRDSGPPDGEVVVCLHGFPQDGTAYDGVSRLLAADGLRVLVPDQRGYSVLQPRLDAAHGRAGDRSLSRRGAGCRPLASRELRR